ncbi:MAG: NeuD/PglB/VioB family sugar acetyltransferase [Synergistaceae bacterium]|nr:NeuD/PglB/VioB family sugar acetyltransferase [Synergistaceae bacterium]
MNKILGIFGAGGLGREVLELARIINAKSQKWSEIYFIVNVEINSKQVNNINVISYEEFCDKYVGSSEITVAVGEPQVREKIFHKLDDDNIKLASLIHPDIYIPDSTIIGRGVTIQYGCFISCNVTIKDYVYIQPHCNIGHDDLLQEGCMISGFGNIAGNVSIGKFTYIGLSAALKEKISIGDKSIIGMGSVVYKNVPDSVVALGNPARVIARNIDGKVFRH